MSNNNYKNKYIKYKSKYNKLKRNINNKNDDIDSKYMEVINNLFDSKKIIMINKYILPKRLKWLVENYMDNPELIIKNIEIDLNYEFFLENREYIKSVLEDENEIMLYLESKLSKDIFSNISKYIRRKNSDTKFLSWKNFYDIIIDDLIYLKDKNEFNRIIDLVYKESLSNEKNYEKSKDFIEKKYNSLKSIIKKDINKLTDEETEIIFEYFKSIVTIDNLKNKNYNICINIIKELLEFIKKIDKISEGNHKCLISYPDNFSKKMEFIKKLNLYKNCDYEILSKNKPYKINTFYNIEIVLILTEYNNNVFEEDYSCIQEKILSEYDEKPITEKVHGNYTSYSENTFYTYPEDLNYVEIIFENNKEYYIINLENNLYSSINSYPNNYDNNNFYFCRMNLDIDITDFKKFQCNFFSFFVSFCYKNNKNNKKFYKMYE
jgi:hypothetical protein